MKFVEFLRIGSTKGIYTPTGHEHGTQLLYLLSQLPDNLTRKKMEIIPPLVTFIKRSMQVLSNPRIGILVDHGMVDDALGPVGVTQRGQSFLEVVSSRTDGSHHDGLAVAAKVVLQQSNNSTVTGQTHHTLRVSCRILSWGDFQ